MKPLKSLFKRRSRYAWLAAEITIASAIAFFVLDPIIVSIYDASRPYNYDYDKLVMVYFHPSKTFEGSDTLLANDIYNMLPVLGSLPEVERAIPLPERGFGSGLDSDESVKVSDSVFVQAFRATYIPGTKFFSTMGFKAAADIPGNPTTEEMDDMLVDYYSQAIVTRSVARMLYGSEYDAMRLSRDSISSYARNGRLLESLQIVGIIEDARAWSTRPWPLLRFYADPLLHSVRWAETGYMRILLRLNDGESPYKLARRFNNDPELKRLASAGGLEFDNAKPYGQVNGADSILSPKERYRNVLMIFFGINIFLGVFGTFWLLTRKRTEEAGIMRSFGAPAWKVRRMLYVEGTILALGCAVLGCGAYVYYLYHNPDKLEFGLTAVSTADSEMLPPELTTWVSDFWPHVGIVSAIVCVLVLVVVLLGIAVPAWRLSRINPVEALRDE